MILPLVPSTDPVLRQKAKPVQNIDDPSIQQLIDDMAETLLAVDGVGLAAPQIGRNVRLAVVHTKEGLVAYINPVIHHYSFRMEGMEEGCLSLPGVFAVVQRPSDVDATVFLRDGTQKRFIAHGMHARVIQHEVDHLNGTLFIDRADPRMITDDNAAVATADENV